MHGTQGHQSKKTDHSTCCESRRVRFFPATHVCRMFLVPRCVDLMRFRDLLTEPGTLFAWVFLASAIVAKCHDRNIKRDYVFHFLARRYGFLSAVVTTTDKLVCNCLSWHFFVAPLNVLVFGLFLTLVTTQACSCTTQEVPLLVCPLEWVHG